MKDKREYLVLYPKDSEPKDTPIVISSLDKRQTIHGGIELDTIPEEDKPKLLHALTVFKYLMNGDTGNAIAYINNTVIPEKKANETHCMCGQHMTTFKGEPVCYSWLMSCEGEKRKKEFNALNELSHPKGFGIEFQSNNDSNRLFLLTRFDNLFDNQTQMVRHIAHQAIKDLNSIEGKSLQFISNHSPAEFEHIEHYLSTDLINILHTKLNW